MRIIIHDGNLLVIRLANGADIILFDSQETGRSSVSMQLLSDYQIADVRHSFNDKHFNRLVYSEYIGKYPIDSELAEMMNRLGYDEDDEHLDT